MDIKDFKEKIFPLKDKIYRRALRILKHVEEAEEIVQEVLIKIWQKRDSIKEESNYESYAMVITRNMCYDKFKTKHYKNKYLSLDEMEFEIVFDSYDPEKYAEYHQANELIENIIEEFPIRWKDIIHLRDVEGYTNQEVAEMLGLTESIVKVTLSRTRKRIREILQKKYNYNYNEN